jgi:hypothetical protein
MKTIIKFRELTDFQKVLFFEKEIKELAKLLKSQNYKIIEQQKEIKTLKIAVNKKEKRLESRRALQREVKRLEFMVIKSRS